MKEFTPLDEFSRLFHYWWLIALCMLLGGVAAFLFHKVNPPLYEATATIMATIDQENFPFQNVREDLIQYNEDMALSVVEIVLQSPDVKQSLFSAAQSQSISLDSASLAKASTLERKQAIWEIRFRDSDPAIAQNIVDLWTEIGYQAMQIWQSDGRIASFVIIEPPSPALLPDTPIAYGLNKLLLAGSLAGLIIGILISAPLGKPLVAGSKHA